MQECNLKFQNGRKVQNNNAQISYKLGKTLFIIFYVIAGFPSAPIPPYTAMYPESAKY